MPLIRATNKAGESVVIPEHWLDNPILGAGFKRYSKPTPTKAAPKATKKEN